MKSNINNITKRNELARELTFNEGDANFQELKNVILDSTQQEKDIRVSALGYIPAKSFQLGYDLINKYHALYNEADSKFYVWNGSLPKAISAGSTPATTGGIAVNAWQELVLGAVSERLDAVTSRTTSLEGRATTVENNLTLTKNELLAADAAIIAVNNQQERDVLVAAAGYVPCKSFQAGFTITTRYQALFNTVDNIFYLWKGTLPKTVPAGSTPASSGGVNINAWQSLSLDSVTGRLDSVTSRTTVVEKDVLVTAKGYLPVKSFQAGYTLTSINQALYNETNQTYYRWGGSYPKVVAAGTLPSSDTLFVEIPLVSLADRLADRLADPSNVAQIAGMPAHRANFTLNSIKDLETAPRFNGNTYTVKGYHVDSTVGGGEFVFNSSRSWSAHNGGTVIAQGALAVWDGVTEAGLTNFLNWTGTGSGCWERLNIEANILNFGAIPNNLNFDSSVAIQSTINYIEKNENYNEDFNKTGWGGIVFVPDGRFLATNLKISKFNIKMQGNSIGSSVIVNNKPDGTLLTASWNDGQSTIGGLEFSDICFRNIVNRSNNAGPVIKLITPVRTVFNRVSFISSPFTNSGLTPLKCDAIQMIAPFEIRGDLHIWGCRKGIGLDIISGPQADTLDLRVIAMYCTVGVILYRGVSGSGCNNFKLRGKIVGYQGGRFVADEFKGYAKSKLATGADNSYQITVADSSKFKIDRAIVVGSSNDTNIAIITNISGNVLSLDRPVTALIDDVIMSGTIGVISAFNRNLNINSVQLEGCDIGLLATGSCRNINMTDCSLSTCVRGVILNSRFRSLNINNMVTGGDFPFTDGEVYQLIETFDIQSQNNIINLINVLTEGTLYHQIDRTKLILISGADGPIANICDTSLGQIFKNYDNSGRTVQEFKEKSYQTFNKTPISFTRRNYQINSVDVWREDFTNSNGDIQWRADIANTPSYTMFGANGDISFNGTWDGPKFRLGSYRFWIDSNGILRQKTSNPSSETDGRAVNNLFSSEWNGNNVFRLGNHRIWVDQNNKLRMRIGNAPDNDLDGVVIGG